MLLDDNQACAQKLTHLHSRQFFMRAERFCLLIKQPRNPKLKMALVAIVEVLDDELQWPAVDQSRELVSTSGVIFHG